ncbi:MAG: tetratricopeptide repeat protein [Dysgonamonadaceae bacterium]|jgi:TolA-binding protein|nr:tetratricopeptide repeat protein [Dysgonamonadaceae bacterium]
MDRLFRGIFLCIFFVVVQHDGLGRQYTFLERDLIFREGRYMFDIGNYAGCIGKMADCKRSFDVWDGRIEEVDYLLVASEFHLGDRDVSGDLHQYLRAYRGSVYSNEVYFMLGMEYCRVGDYGRAVEWFARVELDGLSAVKQEDYAYRLGRSYVETGDYSEAGRLFHLLRLHSVRYHDAAIYHLGCLSYLDKDYSAALSYFNELLDKPDFLLDVKYYLVQIHFAEGRYYQTVTDGLSLLGERHDDERNVSVGRVVGLSYFEEGDYGGAVEYLREYVDSGGDVDVRDRYILGLSYFYEGQYGAVVGTFGDGDPGDDELGQHIYFLLGRSYLMLEEFNKALVSFGAASRMDYDMGVREAAMYNYAMLLHRNSGSVFGESVTVLERFINMYPRSVYVGDASDALVDVYMTTKDYGTALASIGRLREPGVVILEAKQRLLYYLGTQNFVNGAYGEAVSNFTEAVSVGHYASDARRDATYWRGEAYYRLGEYDRAEEDFRTVVGFGHSAGVNGRFAVYGLAYCDFHRRRYDMAAHGFRRYAALGADDRTVADACVRLGDCYFFARRFDDAIAAYERSVALLPASGAYAVFRSGYVLGLKKDYGGKIARMDGLIADYPGSPYVPDALYEKGRAYVLLGDMENAVMVYRFLLDRYPDSGNARRAALQIGLLYFNDGQLDRAVAAYKDVVARYPGSEESRTAVQDLKSVYFEQNDLAGYSDYVRSLGGAVTFGATEQDSLTYLAAERLFTLGEPQKARTAMLSYLGQYPDGAFSDGAHYYLGRMYFDERDFGAAEREFERLVGGVGGRFTEESLVYLSRIYYDDKRYAQALPVYERLRSVAENRANRELGALGVVRTAGHLKEYDTVIAAADVLLEAGDGGAAVLQEARCYRAEAYIATGDSLAAEGDLLALSGDVRTVFGARGRYMLAQYYFDGGRIEDARGVIMEYVRDGTPHVYWLARSIILLAEIYVRDGETLVARQYLESLSGSYKGEDDDIQALIRERLNSFKQ